MDILHKGTGVCAALLVVWCVQVQSEQSCDQTEFLHANGTCVACPACEPGQQLSEDCGFGDGGDGVCTPCEDGKFSSHSGVAPCSRCTKCNLLNRLQRTPCSPTTDALCGQCLPGYYELKSMVGEVEIFCVPCYRHDTVHKECLLFKSQTFKAKTDITESRGNVKDPEEKSEFTQTSLFLLWTFFELTY
ncbi:tumor necrosis factor receptor superfamily member 19-like [Solea solea]|uniref:tumor necrosis factor receptor superfamily member 19-like n=1 Tax=Solea solea TaxID=90069 RepID=UPI00272AE01B|nr:tumor necrosis factor receptor superfamily member 19-like [Solea solea]